LKTDGENAMRLPTRTVIRSSMLMMVGVMAGGQSLPAGTERQTLETFLATAVVQTAVGGKATTPLSVTVDRKMSEREADALAEAFRRSGASGLRKALEGVAPTGVLKLGNGPSTPTRITIERPTDKGRLLTIVTDTPVLFLGAGVPGAKTKAGYDFAVLDLEVDADGRGAGTLAPAARLSVKEGAFVVEDYGSELVRLTAVTRAK
jgi:hypothetical protein